MQKNGLSYSGQWHKLGARLLPHPHSFFFISPCGSEHLPHMLGALLCKPHLLNQHRPINLFNQEALLHTKTLWTRLRSNHCTFIKSLWGGETHTLTERPHWVRREGKQKGPGPESIRHLQAGSSGPSFARALRKALAELCSSVRLMTPRTHSVSETSCGHKSLCYEKVTSHFHFVLAAPPKGIQAFQATYYKTPQM